MGRPRSVTTADLDRAVKVAKAAGLTIVELRLEPGCYRLITSALAAKEKREDSVGPKDWPSDG
jgi:hypothetical protein